MMRENKKILYGFALVIALVLGILIASLMKKMEKDSSNPPMIKEVKKKDIVIVNCFYHAYNAQEGTRTDYKIPNQGEEDCRDFKSQMDNIYFKVVKREVVKRPYPIDWDTLQKEIDKKYNKSTK